MSKPSKTFAIILLAALCAIIQQPLSAEPEAADNPNPPALKLNTTETSLGKINEGRLVETLTVSTDSKRVAYVAECGDKYFMVVDGVEGKEYDGITRGRCLVFDSPTKLHTLAVRDSEFFLVEIEITE